MDLFTQIDGAFAITAQRGVYRQVPLFRRGANVYCKSGSGFAQLIGEGATSIPTLRWVDLSISDNVRAGRLGRLEYRARPQLRAAE